MTWPYSDSFKKNAVSQLLSPSSIGLQATAKKIGISAPTLLYWKKKYANISNNMNNKNTLSKDWTPGLLNKNLKQ